MSVRRSAYRFAYGRFALGRLGLHAFAVSAVLVLAVPLAHADKRIALVIGNSKYVHVAPLVNPANDARLMADTLRDLGFELVGSGPQLDLDEAALRGAVRDFGALLQGADVGLFYYAGHAVEVRKSNYLAPVGANPTREADIDFQMLDANLVLRQMEAAGTKLNLMILDACRNNPFAGRGFRSTTSGLAQMQAPQGTLISFATQPGNVALDGTSGNSPYTKALADAIRKPGLDIFRTFNAVGLAVARATADQQQPWMSLSPIKGDFYFAGRGNDGKLVAGPNPNELSALRKELEQLKSQLSKQETDGKSKVAVGIFPDQLKAAPANARKPGEEFQDCAGCPKMVVIRAGSFTMGEPKPEKEDYAWNHPEHTVRIPKPFALGKFELTLGEFERFTKDSGYTVGPCRVLIPTENPFQPYKYVESDAYNYRDPGFKQTERSPVVCVDWNDAKAYVAWLSDTTGKQYRLPSEAEWEYTARAGTTTNYWWGGSVSKSRSKYDGLTFNKGKVVASEGGPTVPVEKYKPNPWGVYHMHGNAGEWLEDCWNDSYEGAPADGSAWTTGSCDRRVMRGRYFMGRDEGQRSSDRSFYGPDYRFPILGFRVARDLTSEELGQ